MSGRGSWIQTSFGVSLAYEEFLQQGYISPDEIDGLHDTRTLPADFATRVLNKNGPAEALRSVEGLNATEIVPESYSGLVSAPHMLQGISAPSGFAAGRTHFRPVFVYDAAPGKIFLGVHQITFIVNRNTYFDAISSPASKWIAPAFANAPGELRLPGTAAILFANGATLYSHWMFDLLPKLDVLRRAGWSHGNIDHFVVNSFNQPFQFETCEKLGVPRDKIVVANGAVVRADRMLMVSPVRNGLRTPLWVMELIRKIFDCPKSVETEPTLSSKLYISRSLARRRKIQNEEAVRALLERRGFETVFAERMPVADFAKRIARCSQIVAPHGAGAMNVVFASSGTQVLECYGAHLSPEGWFMTEGCGGTHYLLAGLDGEGRYPWQEGAYEGLSRSQRNQADYRLDLGDLEMALGRMEAEALTGSQP